MKTKYLILTNLLLWLVFPLSYPQSTQMGREILNLVNEARAKPQQFLKKHKEDIQKYEPKFIPLLGKATAINAVEWDTALEDMGKAKIVDKELEPKYKGSKKMCGTSSGKSTGDISSDPLKYVCGFYTNVLDENCIYLGIYYQKNGFAFVWGKTCDPKKMTYTFTGTVDSSEVDFRALNTAGKEKYLSDVEKRMVLEINYVRAYPKVYAQIIQQYLAKESADNHGLSKDTYDAGIELIGELNDQRSLSILKPKECIYYAAQKHGEDCRKRGFIDHQGSDGSMPWDRIKNACKGIETGNENLAGNTTIRGAMICLLLDDGISSRGHRYNMLDPKWKYVGCYIYEGEKTKWYTMKYYVQNFAY